MNTELNEQKDPNFLLSTMDAQVWATEYCRLNPGADIGNMIGWFANAIMVGFDEANRRNQAKRDALLTQNTITTVEQDVIDALRGSGFDVRGETADAIVYGTVHHGALLIDAAIQTFWNKSGCDEHFDINVPPFCPICMHVETEKKKVFPFSELMRDWKTGTKSAQDVCAELFHYFSSEPALAERTTSPVSQMTDEPDTSQDWAKLDGATAFHLIERHAEDWAETGHMMESWLAARMAAAAPHGQADYREIQCTQCGQYGLHFCNDVQAAEPVAWKAPRTADELIAFIGPNFASMDVEGPVDDRMIRLSFHDLRSAFDSAGAYEATQQRQDKPNADCSGDPKSCPDNEGYGCACDPMNTGSKKP